MRVNDIHIFFRYDGRQYRRLKKLKTFKPILSNTTRRVQLVMPLRPGVYTFCSPWYVSLEMRSCIEEPLDLAKDMVFLNWVSLCYLVHHIIVSLLETCSLHSILRRITLRMA
jgi:hypothetical protein